MDLNKQEAIIEAILFSSGKEVDEGFLLSSLEITSPDLEKVITHMKSKYNEEDRGIELIKVNKSYQLCTKKELYDYVYPLFNNGIKPTLSNAALEVLSIIAYNPQITRAEIDSIRGVNSDGTMYKLIEYGLIEESGKADLPGKPMTFSVSNEFYKFFGISSLDELPELPKYKLDENEQIVLDEITVEKEENPQ